MSTKVATNNIFASLNDDSDTEAPVKKGITNRNDIINRRNLQIIPKWYLFLCFHSEDINILW